MPTPETALRRHLVGAARRQRERKGTEPKPVRTIDENSDVGAGFYDHSPCGGVSPSNFIAPVKAKEDAE